MTPEESLAAIFVGDAIGQKERVQLQAALKEDPLLRIQAEEQVRVHRALIAMRMQEPQALAEKVRSLSQGNRNSAIFRIITAVEKRCSHRQRWRWIAGCGVAAAAMLLLTVTFMLQRRDPVFVPLAGKQEINTPSSSTKSLDWGQKENRVDIPVEPGVYCWEDGTRIEVSPGSQGKRLPPESRERFALMEGSLRATVAPQDSKTPFIITTPHAQVTVLGTKFNLLTSVEGTWLSVSHGLVQMSSAKEVISVAAGQVMMFGADGTLRQIPRWTDRRLILGWPLARASILANNPNGWFDDMTLDVRGIDGKKRFAERMLSEIDKTCVVLQRLQAQGIIFWDLEGPPQIGQYFGDPRLITQRAPEMDAVADRVFARCKNAGLRTGVRIGNHQWTKDAEGNFTVVLNDDQMLTEMTARMEYAQKRWGCSLFFLGHNLNTAGMNATKIDPKIHATSTDLLIRLRMRFPNALIIAEYLPEDGFSAVSGFLEAPIDDLHRLESARRTWNNADAVGLLRGHLSQSLRINLNALQSADAIPLLIGGDFANPTSLEPIMEQQP